MKGGRVISRRARDALRQSGGRNHFVPSITVYREVLNANNGAYLMQRDIIRKILALPECYQKFYHVTETGRLAMRVIEQKSTIDTFRKAEAHLSRHEMKSLAHSIHGGLTELLERARRPLPLPLGQLDVFGRGKDNLVVQPRGWHGFAGNYSQRDEAGLLTPLGVIVAEKQLCVGAITLAMKNRRGFEAEGLQGEPHITLVTTRGPMGGGHKREITGIVDQCLEPELFLGNPVVHYRLGRRGDDCGSLPVTLPYNGDLQIVA